MAKKKTRKTTKKTTPRSKGTGEKVVFAFRLSPAERDAIHKAAGPRGASQFVLQAALTAAAKTQK
jgi:uncharacterized protein (DUF1778 family)